MINFIIYNLEGKILRTGGHASEADLAAEVGEGELLVKGTANDMAQKIVNGKVVDKTPEEILVDNPPIPEIPWGDQPALITNKEWEAAKIKLGML